MEESKILGYKHFRGDIVIGDPMYFVSQQLKDSELDKPVWRDYFPRDQYTSEMLKDHKIQEEYETCNRRYKQAYTTWIDSQTSDWELCNYGENLELIGFKDPFVFSTEYGLWSCTAYEGMKHNNTLGKFFSDSGLVGVFLLAEIRDYNSDFHPRRRSPKDVAVISKFVGNVFIVNNSDKSGIDADIRLYGVGSTNFHTEQTGY